MEKPRRDGLLQLSAGIAILIGWLIMCVYFANPYYFIDPASTDLFGRIWYANFPLIMVDFSGFLVIWGLYRLHSSKKEGLLEVGLGIVLALAWYAICSYYGRFYLPGLRIDPPFTLMLGIIFIAMGIYTLCESPDAYNNSLKLKSN